MELKPGYKQTEVGVIPENWQQSKIGNIASSARNSVVGGPFGSDLVSADYVDFGVPVIRGQNMGERWVSGNFAFVTSEKANSLSANLARPDDIVFTQRGTLGQVSLVPENSHKRYLVSQSQMKVSLNREIADPLFFYYVFSSTEQQDQIRQNTIQTGVPHINLGILRELPVQLPPLSEQRAIAAALSDTDALLSSLDRLLTKKRDIKQAVMQQLLTGKQRLPGFSGEWEVKRLGDIAAINMGQSPLSQNYNRQSVGVPLIQGNADIENRRTTQRVWTTQITKQCDKNDLILTVRAPVGAVAVASTLSCVGRGVCALKAVGVDKQFLFYALVFSEGDWKILEQGSTFSSANSSQVAAFSVSIAPNIEEQTAIAAVLSDLDAEIDALQQRRDKTRAIKQGMMQELLTGRTRLV